MGTLPESQILGNTFMIYQFYCETLLVDFFSLSMLDYSLNEFATFSSLFMCCITNIFDTFRVKKDFEYFENFDGFKLAISFFKGPGTIVHLHVIYTL